MRILRIDTINVSIDIKGRRTQEPSTLFGRSCCILTNESTHSPTVVQATSWKRASRRQRWHPERCTNELEVGGSHLRYRRELRLLEGSAGGKEKDREYFDGIMVGRCREHRIQIYQKTTFIGFTTHATK